MKTALCLYGQPRNLHEGYVYINKHILEQFQPDVFIHMWEVTKKYEMSPWANQYSKIYSSNDVRNLYNPTVIQCEKARRFLEYRDSPSYIHSDEITQKNSSNILSQIHSRQCVRDILKKHSEMNNIVYDRVIMTRFDNTIESLIKPTYEDYIYFANTHGERQIFDDNLIMTNQHNFLKLMNIEKILPILLYKEPVIKFNIEELIVASAVHNRLLHKCRKSPKIQIGHINTNSYVSMYLESIKQSVAHFVIP